MPPPISGPFLVSQTQHLGRSAGGGGNFWLGWGPSNTIHAILSPQLVWISKWQCINQTPALHIFKASNFEIIYFSMMFNSLTLTQ